MERIVDVIRAHVRVYSSTFITCAFNYIYANMTEEAER